MSRRRVSLVLVAAALALALGSCSRAPQLQDVGLPGTTISDSYQVSAQFKDVLDLVPLAMVKMDGVRVGVVETVQLTSSYVAEVVMSIESDKKVPHGTRASVAQSSLLGEKYIELESPLRGEGPPMGDGDTIPLSRTDTAVEVETLLNGASALLNGGGIGNLQVVTRELSAALQGREEALNAGLRDLDAVVTGVDERREDIVRALEGVDRLTQSLAGERDVVAQALDRLPDGIAALEGQRAVLTDALIELDRFGTVASRVIARTRTDTVANLELLDPILAEIAKAAPSFFDTLDTLLTYPFARNIYGGVAGDYVQLAGELEIDLAALLRDGFGPGPDLGDPDPAIQCGQFGSNCTPGPLTPRPSAGDPSEGDAEAPDVLGGRELLEALGRFGR
jgi:phospholipid/cholesterol/gamma-HCH transport system substrate-binding protein